MGTEDSNALRFRCARAALLFAGDERDPLARCDRCCRRFACRLMPCRDAMTPMAHVWVPWAIVAGCVAAASAIALVQDPPAQPHPIEFALGASPDGIPWDGRPIAAAFLAPIVYNETRDATLAGFLICSHHFCGPLVWVHGNVTKGGPFVLRTDADRLSLEMLAYPAPPAQNASADPSQPMPTPTSPSPRLGPAPTQYDGVNQAIAQTFEASPGLPIATAASLLRVAPLLLLALAPQGLPWWRRSAIPAAVFAGWWLAYNARQETWGLLAYDFFLGLAFLSALIILISVAILRRPLHPEVLAIFALTLAFFMAISALKPYFPVEGGE